MIKPNRLKLNHFRYSATLLVAMPVVFAALLAAPTANAQLNHDHFRWCSEGIKNVLDLEDWQYWDLVKDCCLKAGGVWDDKGHNCLEDQMDTWTPPGNVGLRPDLVNAPVLTQAPPRPIRVPSDIATEQAVSQAPG